MKLILESEDKSSKPEETSSDDMCDAVPDSLESPDCNMPSINPSNMDYSPLDQNIMLSSENQQIESMELSETCTLNISASCHSSPSGLDAVSSNDDRPVDSQVQAIESAQPSNLKTMEEKGCENFREALDGMPDSSALLSDQNKEENKTPFSEFETNCVTREDDKNEAETLTGTNTQSNSTRKELIDNPAVNENVIVSPSEDSKGPKCPDNVDEVDMLVHDALIDQENFDSLDVLPDAFLSAMNDILNQESDNGASLEGGISEKQLQVCDTSSKINNENSFENKAMSDPKISDARQSIVANGGDVAVAKNSEKSADNTDVSCRVSSEVLPVEGDSDCSLTNMSLPDIELPNTDTISDDKNTPIKADNSKLNTETNIRKGSPQKSTSSNHSLQFGVSVKLLKLPNGCHSPVTVSQDITTGKTKIINEGSEYNISPPSFKKNVTKPQLAMDYKLNPNQSTNELMETKNTDSFSSILKESDNPNFNLLSKSLNSKVKTRKEDKLRSSSASKTKDAIRLKENKLKDSSKKCNFTDKNDTISNNSSRGKIQNKATKQLSKCQTTGNVFPDVSVDKDLGSDFSLKGLQEKKETNMTNSLGENNHFTLDNAPASEDICGLETQFNELGEKGESLLMQNKLIGKAHKESSTIESPHDKLASLTKHGYLNLSGTDLDELEDSLESHGLINLNESEHRSVGLNASKKRDSPANMLSGDESINSIVVSNSSWSNFDEDSRSISLPVKRKNEHSNLPVSKYPKKSNNSSDKLPSLNSFNPSDTRNTEDMLEDFDFLDDDDDDEDLIMADIGDFKDGSAGKISSGIDGFQNLSGSDDINESKLLNDSFDFSDKVDLFSSFKPKKDFSDYRSELSGKLFEKKLKSDVPNLWKTPSVEFVKKKVRLEKMKENLRMETKFLAGKLKSLQFEKEELFIAHKKLQQGDMNLEQLHSFLVHLNKVNVDLGDSFTAPQKNGHYRLPGDLSTKDLIEKHYGSHQKEQSLSKNSHLSLKSIHSPAGLRKSWDSSILMKMDEFNSQCSSRFVPAIGGKIPKKITFASCRRGIFRKPFAFECINDFVKRITSPRYIMNLINCVKMPDCASIRFSKQKQAHQSLCNKVISQQANSTESSGSIAHHKNVMSSRGLSKKNPENAPQRIDQLASSSKLNSVHKYQMQQQKTSVNIPVNKMAFPMNKNSSSCVIQERKYFESKYPNHKLNGNGFIAINSTKKQLNQSTSTNGKQSLSQQTSKMAPAGLKLVAESIKLPNSGEQLPGKIFKNSDDKFIFSCALCTFKTFCVMTYQNHFMNHMEPGNSSRLLEATSHGVPQPHDSNPNQLKCSLCNFKTSSKLMLQNHEKSHPACKFCKRPQVSEAALQMHVEKKLCSVGNLLQCNDCKFITYSKTQMEQHVMVHVKEDGKHQCSECGFGFTNPLSLKNHRCPGFLKEVPSNRASDVNRFIKPSEPQQRTFKSLSCKAVGCSYKASNEQDLARHVKVHERSQKLGCPFCEFFTSSEDALENHITKHLE